MKTKKRAPLTAKTKATKAKLQAAYNKTEKATKKRKGDNKARAKLGLKVGDTRDASRQKGGGFKAEARSSNRSRGWKKGNRAAKVAGGRKGGKASKGPRK